MTRTPATLNDFIEAILSAAAERRTAMALLLGLSETEMRGLEHVLELDSCSLVELRSRLGLSSGGITTLVQRLEQRGHLSRRSDPDDRRSFCLTLSATTAARLSALVDQHSAGIEASLEHLSRRDRTAVEAALAAASSTMHGQAAAIRAQVPVGAAEPPPAVPVLWS